MFPELSTMATLAQLRPPRVNGNSNFDAGSAPRHHPLRTGVVGTAAPQDPSPPSDGPEDDYFYGDQDDAQSFIQPAISPMATRMASPKTPTAEKAAAMQRLSGGGFLDGLDEADHRPTQSSAPPISRYTADAASGSIRSPNKLSKPPPSSPSAVRDRGMTLGSIPSPQPYATDFPTPWQAGLKQFITEPGSSKTAMSGIFGGQSTTRHQRSSSVGENALRRLSKALPSISIPTGFMPNISTPSFFSSSSSQKDELATHTQKPTSPPVHARIAPSHSSRQEINSLRPPVRADISAAGVLESGRPAFARPPSAASRRSYALRKSTSDDSLLYHSLSRVSSLGDDERFSHIREQVNSRFKAIKDSWDGPSFKMPQFPSFNAPYKRGTASSTDPIPSESRSGATQNGLRTSQGSIHPLDTVLESLTGDIVVMGGYRGSVLRSAQAPYRQLWVPVKVGLKIRKVNLEVGLEPEDEESMEKHIFASGMLQNIGPVDLSRRLFKKLRECENARSGKLRVHDYGYDWRLSPHLLSRKLIDFLEKLPSNQRGTPKEQRGVWVIAHSLGGLITRHAVNQRPELFAGVVYAGTPQRCVNIVGPLRNGDAVLLNEKVLTAQVNFSLRTTFIFLPEDGFCFVDKHTNEEIRIDFYNVEDWVKYRLSPCVSGPALPPPPLSRNNGNTFGSLLSLPDSLPSFQPLKKRSNSQHQKRAVGGGGVQEVARRAAADLSRDRTLAPQMSSSSSPSPPHGQTHGSGPDMAAARARNLAYLTRTLREIKQFRAELAHNTTHQQGNVYPPLSVIYAKDIPTVYAARVAGREGIACADAYDDLVFRSGDGVVLARESMLPAGYALVKGGRVCTDRGHVTLLGDLVAVGKALEAVVRGRRKGVGMGVNY
ncbi:hypothetical protein QBC46DRAFT_378708 [Diplogelasinospora grovesii]|uniref:Uncharacterized protein n=1 Tax=Diplogelasinospora grovesii TaxID=303347 RepID=A0AAN6S775_9PEZI|nr:hypothetical protein QBC46DRAFT_378708 [Diplogelasinospora grovesii]